MSHEHSHEHAHDHEHSHGHDGPCHPHTATKNRLFGVFFVFFLLGIVVLYGGTVDYDESTSNLGAYPAFQDIHVMTFVGLGFLLTVISRNGLSALTHSFAIAAFVILWYILNRGFFSSALGNLPKKADWKVIKLNLETFVHADFAAFAVVISLGALVGRLSGGQLLVVALFETIFYAFQENIVYEHLHIVDSGGAMSIHAFGAFFGVFTSLIVELGDARKKIGEKATAGSTHASNVTALIGTLFLWVFFPSFNAVMANSNLDSQRAIVNTILSLASSAVTTFALLTIIFHDKFHAQEIQNSTIAGGVAIAAVSTMQLGAYAAIIVGAVGATVSIIGFRFVQPFLACKIGLQDSRGVLSSHGLTGIVGGLTGIIVSRVAEKDTYGASFSTVFPWRSTNGRTAQGQARYQLAGVAVSLAFAIFGGVFVGTILRLLPSLDSFYDDKDEFEQEDVKA